MSCTPEKPVYHPALPFREGNGVKQTDAIFSCPVKVGVLDIETAATAGLGAFNDFFVETQEGGLNPSAGEILLSGVRPASSGKKLTQFYKGGEKRILEKTFEACDFFSREGLLVGHNSMGFDLPFMAIRAAVLGVPIPLWVTSGKGVFDTYKMFNTGYGKFSTGMLSLQETAAMWGREPDADSGANFGDLWRGGTEGQRNALRHYNMLNLVDTLCLSLHSGILGSPEGTTRSCTIGGGWENSGEYKFEAERVSKTDPSAHFFQWITAPKPGLMEKGPRIISGWGRTHAPDAKKEYPRGPGRLDAGSSIVVGHVSSGSHFLNQEDEALAIESGLEEIRRLSSSGETVFTDSPNISKNYICLRLSVHGGILPKWFSQESLFSDDKIRAMGEDYVRAVAMSAGVKDARIPCYTGNGDSEFIEYAFGVAAHRANISLKFSG